MAKNDGDIVCFEELAKAIVKRAVLDWNKLNRGDVFYSPTKYRTANSPIKVSYDEIIEFFMSDEADTYCRLLNSNRYKIIDALEKMRADGVVLEIDEEDFDNDENTDDADEYDPCDHCTRNLCYGCPHCRDTEA